MNSKNTFLKIGIGILTAGILGYFYLTSERSSSYNWNPHFKASSRDPYGCYLFYELLKADRNSKQFREIKSPVHRILQAEEELLGATYFFVGEKWFYTEEDIEAISAFVARGNNAYIISKEAPYPFLSSNGIYSQMYIGSFIDYGTSMYLKGNEQQKPVYTYLFDWEKEKYKWVYADSVAGSTISVKGKLTENRSNFFSLNLEKGTLYFHLTPLVLTNYFLRDKDKLAYANEVLSGLGDGPIYWDSFSGLPYDGSETTQSPLSFILSQESLRWAWYLLVAIGVIYIIMYTRRKERVIPVINKPRNTSIDFIRTIGAMYRHQSAHLKIVHHQNQLFLTYIRTKYGISTGKDEGEFVKRASLKSGVEDREIDQILKEARRLERKGEASSKELIAFNQMTEVFYKNCK